WNRYGAGEGGDDAQQIRTRPVAVVPGLGGARHRGGADFPTGVLPARRAHGAGVVADGRSPVLVRGRLYGWAERVERGEAAAGESRRGGSTMSTADHDQPATRQMVSPTPAAQPRREREPTRARQPTATRPGRCATGAP